MDTEKIIVFEIDFWALKTSFTSTELAHWNKLFCRLGAYNHLFIVTNNSFEFALQSLKEFSDSTRDYLTKKSNLSEKDNLPFGYLLSNSGSIAYDFSSGLKIYEHFLDTWITQIILKVSFINNLTCIIYSADSFGNFKTFAFGLNHLNYQLKLIFNRYTQLRIWGEVVEMLKKHSIYSIEVLFQEKKKELLDKKIDNFLSNFLEFKHLFEHLISSPTIYFFSPLVSKFEAIQEITKLSRTEIEENLIYVSLTFPDLKLASKAYFWISCNSFLSFIEKEFPLHQVIYLGKEQHMWLKWWDEHDYLWRENAVKLDWLSKKIKKFDFSKFKEKRQELKNNIFELNLNTGTLSSKILNKRERWWDSMHKKTSDDEKNWVSDVYLWPEQLKSLLDR